MYCPFEATTMNKQICFVLLSCVFARVDLQETIGQLTVETLIRFKMHDLNQYESEPLFLSRVLFHESFTVMSQRYRLVHVGAINTNDEEFICTAVLKTEYKTKSLNVIETECKRDDGYIPWTQSLVSHGYFQKTIYKAVDLIGNETAYSMIATSFSNITLKITGGEDFVYMFELTVAKTACAYTPRDDNVQCPIVTGNKASSKTYTVVGRMEHHSPDVPVVDIKPKVY